MKTTISGIVSPGARPYPKIMRSPSTGNFVLFSSHGVGTIIHTQSGNSSRIGSHSDRWTMECFEDVHGLVTITFENE